MSISMNPGSSDQQHAFEIPGLNINQKAAMTFATVGGIAIAATTIGPAVTAILSFPLFAAGLAAGLAALSEKVISQKDTNNNPNEKIINEKAIDTILVGEHVIENKSIIKNMPQIDNYEEIDDNESILGFNYDSDNEPKTEINSPTLLKELLIGLGGLFQNGKNKIATSRHFYIELAKIMETLSPEKKRELITKLIVDTDELDGCFKEIVIGKNMTLNGEKQKFLDVKETAILKANLFGLDLQEFLIKEAPVENLDNLKQFMKILDRSKLFTRQEVNDVKSSILCRLNKHLVEKNKIGSESPYSFQELKSFIVFIKNESVYGPEITSSVLIDNTLTVGYDSDEDSDIESNVRNGNLHTEEEFHYSSIDDLQKLAAFYRLKEFQPDHFNLPEFTAMLKETESFLGDIDQSHPLFLHFHNECAIIIDRYSNNLEVFDITELKNNLKPVYDQLVSKLNHDKLEINVFTENDTTVVNEIAFNDLIGAYIQDGFTIEEAEEMARIDLNYLAQI